MGAQVIKQQNKLTLEVNSVSQTEYFLRKNQICELDKLKSLFIDFSEDLFEDLNNKSIFEDDSINTLLTNIDDQFPESLKNLRMDFICCYGLKDSTLINIVNKLPKNLKTLEINLFNCKKITNQSIKSLCQKIPQGLTQLSLNLGDCSKITEKSFNYLTSLVHELKSLELLDLTFTWQDSLNNTSVKQFLQKLSENLKHIRLNFEHCSKLSYKTVNYLQEQLQTRLTNLQSLNIDLSDCQKVTAESVNQLADTFPQNITYRNFRFSRCFNGKNNEQLEKKIEELNSSSGSINNNNAQNQH